MAKTHRRPIFTGRSKPPLQRVAQDPSCSPGPRNGTGRIRYRGRGFWQLDTHCFSAGAGQRWYLRRKPSIISVLSFDVNYDQYLDDFYSEASAKDLTFWLKFSHEFGARPLLVPNLVTSATPGSKRSSAGTVMPTKVDKSQTAEDESSEAAVTIRLKSDIT